MTIDLSELEKKLSCGTNLTIKESTILLESIEGFIDDKIELEEQLNTAKQALTEISNHYLTDESYEGDADYREIAIDALAAIGGGEDE